MKYGLYQVLWNEIVERTKKGMSLEEASKNVKDEFLASGPDKKNLKKYAKNFGKKHSCRLKAANESERTLQKRMRHVEACLDALMEEAEKMAKKTNLVMKTAEEQLKSVGVKLKNGQKVETFRCLQDMMHLDNNSEANLHNQQVVSLMLLNQGLINEGQYKKLRTEQFEKNYTEKLETAEAAEKTRLENQREEAKHKEQNCIAWEAEHKSRAILNLIKEEVKALKTRSQAAETGLEVICNINETDRKKLKEAYSAICDSKAELLRTGVNIFGQNAYKWPDDVNDDDKKWVVQNLDHYGCDKARKYYAVDCMANPYYAIMKPEEMYEHSRNACMTKRSGEIDEFSAYETYAYSANLGLVNNDDWDKQTKHYESEVNKMLTKAGMIKTEEKPEKNEQEIIKPTKKEYLYCFTAYQQNQDVLITKEEMISAVPLKINVRLAKPAEFLTCNFQMRVDKLFDQYKERKRGFSWGDYGKMGKALKRLRTLSERTMDDASPEQLKACQEAFEKLKEKAEQYLQHKEDDFYDRGIPIDYKDGKDGFWYKNHSGHAKNEYEKKRIELAEAIIKYANTGIKTVKLIGQYGKTLKEKNININEIEAYKDAEEKKQELNPAMNDENNGVDKDRTSFNALNQNGIDASRRKLVGSQLYGNKILNNVKEPMKKQEMQKGH